MKIETAKLCSMESFQGIRKYEKVNRKPPLTRTFVSRGGLDPYASKEQVKKELAKFIADMLYKYKDKLLEKKVNNEKTKE